MYFCACLRTLTVNQLKSGPISMAELYFGIRINPAVAIFFMWSVVWVGYSYAAIARQFLLYDPQYPWFSAYVFLCRLGSKVLTEQVVPNRPFRNTKKTERAPYTSFQKTDEGVLFLFGIHNHLAIPSRVYLSNARLHGIPLLGSSKKCHGKLPWLWFWWNGPVKSVIRLVKFEQS